VGAGSPPPIDVFPAPGPVAATDQADAIVAGGDDHLPVRPLARAKVTVVAAETHFPPVVTHSPLDQIIHCLAADLGAADLGATGHAVDPAVVPHSVSTQGEPREGSAACVRSLTLLLEPASLGPVTTKLRLTGTTLGLEIEADEAETTRLIGRGRHTLTDKLRALGLSVGSLEVSDAGRPRRSRYSAP